MSRDRRTRRLRASPCLHWGFALLALCAALRLAWLPIHLATHAHAAHVSAGEHGHSSEHAHDHGPVGEHHHDEPRDHEPHPSADHIGELLIARQFEAPELVALPCVAFVATHTALERGTVVACRIDAPPRAPPLRGQRARAPPLS